MKSIIAIISISLICSGCGTAQLEQRIKRLESSLNDIRSFQAEQTTQIASVQSEMRKLTGKTEEIEFTQSKKLGSDLDSLKADLSTLKRRVPPPANVPSQPLEEDERLAESSSQADFGDALLKLRSGNYRDALTILGPLLQSASSDLSPNILFWMGVSYDGLDQGKSALQSYYDLVTQFPKHRRAPLALLRQASTLEKGGDSKMSGVIIQKLINDYPDSPEARLMQSRMAPPAPPASKPVASKPLKKFK